MYEYYFKFTISLVLDLGKTTTVSTNSAVTPNVAKIPGREPSPIGNIGNLANLGNILAQSLATSSIVGGNFAAVTAKVTSKFYEYNILKLELSCYV